MAFRSIVISLTAAVTTLLSAFIGFGVLTLVIQEGYLLELTGLDRTGPIETFVPPIAFAILFGLSMDYMVFLMSRIREEHVHGLTTREAVEHGRRDRPSRRGGGRDHGHRLRGLHPHGDRISKEFGLLLAVAILTDALVVRMTLVPAFLTLMGEKSYTSRAGSTGSCDVNHELDITIERADPNPPPPPKTHTLSPPPLPPLPPYIKPAPPPSCASEARAAAAAVRIGSCRPHPWFQNPFLPSPPLFSIPSP